MICVTSWAVLQYGDPWIHVLYSMIGYPVCRLFFLLHAHIRAEVIGLCVFFFLPPPIIRNHDQVLPLCKIWHPCFPANVNVLCSSPSATRWCCACAGISSSCFWSDACHSIFHVIPARDNPIMSANLLSLTIMKVNTQNTTTAQLTPYLLSLILLIIHNNNRPFGRESMTASTCWNNILPLWSVSFQMSKAWFCSLQIWGYKKKYIYFEIFNYLEDFCEQ